MLQVFKCVDAFLQLKHYQFCNLSLVILIIINTVIFITYTAVKYLSAYSGHGLWVCVGWVTSPTYNKMANNTTQ